MKPPWLWLQETTTHNCHCLCLPYATTLHSRISVKSFCMKKGSSDWPGTRAPQIKKYFLGTKLVVTCTKISHRGLVSGNSSKLMDRNSFKVYRIKVALIFIFGDYIMPRSLVKNCWLWGHQDQSVLNQMTKPQGLILNSFYIWITFSFTWIYFLIEVPYQGPIRVILGPD